MKHAIVWIDQKEARILEVDAEKTGAQAINSPGRHLHRHAKEQELRERNHPADEQRFFGEVARDLRDDGQILLVGPSMTKLHFFKYVQQHDHPLAARVVGIESADHPTDGQLVAHLRHYFNEEPARRQPQT